LEDAEAEGGVGKGLEVLDPEGGVGKGLEEEDLEPEGAGGGGGCATATSLTRITMLHIAKNFGATFMLRSYHCKKQC